MSSYQIGSVRYVNFGPFKDETLDFSVPGLTGIDGVIDWKPGSDSNGSGKSMLLEGPSFCFFGRCLRENFKGDDVVRIGSEGGCMVEGHVVGGPHPIMVRRYRQHTQHKNRVFLFVGGEDVSRGTDPETQHAIEALLGIDFHTFCNSVAFGAREDVRSFFAAPDATRKAVLERMLGLELYARSQQVARQRLTEETQKAAVIQSKVDKSQAKLEQALATAQAVSAYGDVGELEFLKSKAALRVKLRATTVTKKLEAWTESKKGRELAVTADSATRAAWDSECENNAEERAGIQKEIQRLKGLAVKANTQWRSMKVRRDKLEGVGQECPTCGQEVLDAVRNSLMADLKKSMDKELKARNKALQQVSETDELLDAVVDPDWEPSSAVVLANTDVQVSLTAVSEAKGAHKEAVAASQGATTLWEKAKSHHEHNVEQVESLTTALAEASEKYGVAQKHLAQISFWVEGFGNKGLKSFLIEAAIPDINSRATKYAQALLGQGVKVKLSATTKLKSKDAVREKLTVEGSIPGCCSSYAGASKGQKRRLDLSLLLAFREIIAERSTTPFDQFFADELFDGLDKSGCESVAALLHDLSEARPVILVTHSPWLKSSVDRLITVRHVEQFQATLAASKVVSKVKKKTLKKKPLLQESQSGQGKKLKAKLAAKPKV